MTREHMIDEAVRQCRLFWEWRSDDGTFAEPTPRVLSAAAEAIRAEFRRIAASAV